MINYLLGKTYSLDVTSMPRYRDRPRPPAAVLMTADDIAAAASVLDRKHARGELTDSEYRSLVAALRSERERVA